MPSTPEQRRQIAAQLGAAFAKVKNLSSVWTDPDQLLSLVDEATGELHEFKHVTDNFHQKPLQGTPDFSKLPQTVKRIEIPLSNLSGTIDLTNLPPNLEKLDLKSNT